MQISTGSFGIAGRAGVLELLCGLIPSTDHGVYFFGGAGEVIASGVFYLCEVDLALVGVASPA